jgi:hypothetical protein
MIAGIETHPTNPCANQYPGASTPRQSGMDWDDHRSTLRQSGMTYGGGGGQEGTGICPAVQEIAKIAGIAKIG